MANKCPTFDTSGKYWVVGGGGGGIGGDTGLSRGGGGNAPSPVETYAGGGAGGFAPQLIHKDNHIHQILMVKVEDKALVVVAVDLLVWV